MLAAGCAAEPPSATQSHGPPPSAAASSLPAEPPRPEFYRSAGEAAILNAARAIIASDRNAGLVTLDERGRPRIRTVYTSEPEDDMTIWVATRPSTRKVEQIRRNAAVALYYSDDPGVSYVSVMGTATLHDDPETIEAKTFFEETALREFWPEYPKDFLLIRIRPQWIEVTGRGIEAHSETWRPQAFEPRR